MVDGYLHDGGSLVSSWPPDIAANAGRNLPVKEFCYLRTVNLTAAVCKERDGSGCNKKVNDFTLPARQWKGIQGLVNRLALMKVSRNNGAAVTKDSLGLLWNRYLSSGNRKVIRLCGHESSLFQGFNLQDKEMDGDEEALERYERRRLQDS